MKQDDFKIINLSDRNLISTSKPDGAKNVHKPQPNKRIK